MSGNDGVGTVTRLGYASYGVHWQDKTTALCFVGGLLVGAVAGSRMVLKGKVTGISGIFSRAIDWSFQPSTLPAKVLSAVFVAGLVCGGAIAMTYLPDAFEDWSTLPLGRLASAGLIVGVGVRMGSGCTSGHGICGISSFRLRSLVATCTFMATGFVTAMAANTSAYLPPFQNTLPYGPAVAVAFVGIACCGAVVAVGAVFSDELREGGHFADRFHVVTEFLFGANFALAMAVSNMTKLSATISFLDLRYWNPALAFVMVAGIAVTLAMYTVAFRRGAPLLADTFDLSSLSHVDAKLVVGAALFGVGWGLAGACPAPMLTNVAGRAYPAVYFSFMVLGMWCQMYVIDPVWEAYVVGNRGTGDADAGEKRVLVATGVPDTATAATAAVAAVATAPMQKI